MSKRVDEVGYKKPPKHSQFKTGQSGNPNGRPKKTGSTELNLDVVLKSSIMVNTPNGPKSIDTREVELRQQVEKALKGELPAVKFVLGKFEKYNAMTPPASKIMTGVLYFDVQK